MHTFSSRDFTRDVSAAKRAAKEGPVFITDRGQPTHALLSIEEYHRLTGANTGSLLDLMKSLPRTDGIAFEPPRLEVRVAPADLA